MAKIQPSKSQSRRATKHSRERAQLIELRERFHHRLAEIESALAHPKRQKAAA